MPQARFITFEGIDGSGKSTQTRTLAANLKAVGADVILTREPGGSPGAEEIRELVLTGDPDRWSAETEILLFTASRRDHLEKTINPALAAGKTVISDRFADSTRVYQGATRGDLRHMVDQLHTLMIGREPDVTFVIDMDPEVALNRAVSRIETQGANEGEFISREVAKTSNRGMSPQEMRFESMGLAFQETLRHGFLALAKANPDRCILINGNRAPDEIATDIATQYAARCDPLA